MMPAESRWLPIDSRVFDVDTPVTRRGVEFHVFMSPYDLPEAVRGRFDPELNRFAIEFRYLSDEELLRVEIDEHVVFSVGTKSMRLHQIEVDVKGLGASQVALRIDHALDCLPSRLRSPRPPRANFEVAKTVLHKKQPELLATLGA